ncbi:uncharacterized protein LOC129230208 [Uloborus diversus]|uniref:uncharacterized protein LOC129230208 n=1 Tax=Uloborus diversus TaxID=327109 RepID=UPI00240A8D57|nr:uncharacterized protein LOC129230208 [Uloborus diversus]
MTKAGQGRLLFQLQSRTQLEKRNENRVTDQEARPFYIPLDRNNECSDADDEESVSLDAVEMKDDSDSEAKRKRNKNDDMALPEEYLSFKENHLKHIEDSINLVSFYSRRKSTARYRVVQ